MSRKARRRPSWKPLPRLEPRYCPLFLSMIREACEGPHRELVTTGWSDMTDAERTADMVRQMSEPWPEADAWPTPAHDAWIAAKSRRAFVPNRQSENYRIIADPAENGNPVSSVGMWSAEFINAQRGDYYRNCNGAANAEELCRLNT